MVMMSFYVSGLLGDDGSPPDVQTLTYLFFCLFFMMATQDIAVDGWALTILSGENVGFASTANSVGQTLGYFISYVGFLALNDPGTCNKWLRYTPSDEPLVTLGGFLAFWGWVFVAVTLAVWLLKREKHDDDEEDLGVKDTYMQLWSVLQLSSVQSLCVVMVTCKMGFAAADSVTSLKIVEYGFPKEDLALMSPILIPIGILVPIVIARYTSGPDPLGIFMLGVWPRIIVGLLYVGVVMVTKEAVAGNGGSAPAWLYWVIIGSAIIHSIASNLMFVAQMSFFNRVSDERIGGTYMTLLNTVANLGSKWPSSLVMFLVDPLTTKACTNISGNTCATPDMTKSCTDGGGSCSIITDGFYILSAGCTIVGVIWFFAMQGRVQRLRAMGPEKWQVRAH